MAQSSNGTSWCTKYVITVQKTLLLTVMCTSSFTHEFSANVLAFNKIRKILANLSLIILRVGLRQLITNLGDDIAESISVTIKSDQFELKVFHIIIAAI